MKIKLIALLVLLFGFFIYGYIETFRIGVTHVVIRNHSLYEVLKDKTIAHVTDIHSQTLGYREHKLFQILDEIKPDIIFLTGDYIRSSTDVRAGIRVLSQFRAPYGVYGINGDHEYLNSRQSCLFCHQEGTGEKTVSHSVVMLKNNMETISIDGRDCVVIGLDIQEKESHAQEKFKDAFNKKKGVIILSHDPLAFDLFDRDRSFFMMAGDTHGGQIPLPSFIWRIMGYDKNAKYNYGLFIDGKKQMFVSRGIGFSHFPIRLFCPPEIVVYHFKDE